MALLRIKYLWKPLLGVLALSLVLPVVVRPQDDEESDQEKNRAPFEVGEATSDLLSSLKQFEETKNWDGAIQAIQGQLRKVKSGSYDEEMLYRALAQQTYQKSDFMGSMAAAEHCLQIDDQHHYLDRRTRRDMLYWVAQIAFNEGSSAKVAAQQAVLYAKADKALDEWLKGTKEKEFTPDNLLFVAMLYFYRAQPGAGAAGVEEKTDREMMEKALQWTDKGLHSMARPRDNFYQLKLAELFQLGRFREGAELLETIIKKKPESKNYWQQLFNTYVQLASEAQEKHDDQAVLTENIRAIVTAERAQKLGFLNSQKDNFNLAVIYLSIGQFGEACGVLDQGLKNNTIERKRENYELLANSLQQIHRNTEAIRTLEDAAKLFPHSGQLEYEIAQIYFADNKSKDAFEHMKRCVEKGGTEDPPIGWMFYAYLALDLKEYDLAIKAAQEVQKYPKHEKEGKQMEDAINATKADREARLKSQGI